MSHTAGPWYHPHFDHWGNVYTEQGALVATASNERDARLIAAAPAMYELLLDVEWSSYDDQRGPNCPKCRALMPMGHYPECSLGAAITAIRGEVEVQS